MKKTQGEKRFHQLQVKFAILFQFFFSVDVYINLVSPITLLQFYTKPSL